MTLNNIMFVISLPAAVNMGSENVLGIRQISDSTVKVGDLCPKIQQFINEQVKICQPDRVYVCDGSDSENRAFIQQLLDDGRFVRLTKYDNW